jgi:hypothetical protein
MRDPTGDWGSCDVYCDGEYHVCQIGADWGGMGRSVIVLGLQDRQEQTSKARIRSPL